MIKRFSFLNGLVFSAIVPAMSFAATMDSRIDTLEKQVSMSTTTNTMGGMGAKNASALPDNDNEGWHLQLGFVYEQPRIGGTQFAIKSNTPSTSSRTLEDVSQIDANWSFGIVAGLGYKVPERMWDCSLDYMYLKNTTNAQANSGLLSSVLPVKAKFNIIDDSTLLTSVGRAKSDFNFVLNSLDATASNPFFVQEKFSFGFKGGVRTQWLSLKQNTTYSGGSALGVNSVYVNDKSRFWGIGPTGSLNNMWDLGKGFSIFTNSGLSLLYAKFKVYQDQIYSVQTNADYYTSNSFGRIVPELDFNIGLAYGSFFKERKHYLRVRLGWDFHYMFRVNQMLANMDSYTQIGETLNQQRRSPNVSEDVALQGILFDVRWDF
ncbi:MAG: hypothetical protein K9M07_01235 [Simkaniaceae bacterium]|nr:hypothetical protein [Simkaniaceae bacterium]